MRAPGSVGTYFLRAGMVLLAASLVSGGVAEAATKKKKTVAKPTASRVVDSGVWQRGYSDIVIDANTGRILHQDNPDALRHPASVTKVMTLYLLFEQLEARRLRLDSQLQVSANAARQQPSKLGVKAGQTISVEDAIQALVTRSANDVAVVIAENISGDTNSFAQLMTRRARQLGMSRTTFKNPHGLPNPQQVTTARDLATLGRAVQERFPRYYAYFETRSFNYRGATIRTHNRLLGRIDGVDGIKTGYTNASGFNLLTSVKRDGRYVIGVVLGGTSGASRDNRMAALITEALPKAYSGRQQVARMDRAPSGAVDDTPVEIASAPAPTPAPNPVALIEPVASAAPAVIPVPQSNPRIAMASAAGPVATAEADPVVTGAVPTPPAAPVRVASIDPAAALPAAGSAAPIVPTTVKTVAVVRPSAAPTATFSNQPGILGTLSFSSPEASSQKVATAPAQQALKKAAPAQPVQVASLGSGDIPLQAAQAAGQAAAPRSGWAIQIGAFGSEADARAQLAKAKGKAPQALSNVDPYTETAVKGSTPIVRARFAGFDAESAARKACQALKRSDFGCMVFRN